VHGEEGRILACLEGGTASVDHVARVVGLDVRSTLTVLSRLEILGSVERVAGMRFRRAG